MERKLLLDNSPLDFDVNNFPCLIHGAPQAGSSLFTVSLLAQLYRRDYKVLFLSGFHMAREEFELQTETKGQSLLIQSANDLATAETHKIIYVKRENPDLFVSLLRSLPDIAHRVILVKNFELFAEPVFTAASEFRYLVMSGDLDKCAYREKLLKHNFNSKILFSQPKTSIGIQLKPLEKYHGYFVGKKVEGVVSLEASPIK